MNFAVIPWSKNELNDYLSTLYTKQALQTNIDEE